MFIKDDLNRNIFIPSIPQKIISLCPSITETLCDIGLSAHIIGITDYCIHPGKITKRITKIGGPVTVSVEKIIQLSPDIIFASKEENDKYTIDLLSKKFNCFVFDVKTFQHALNMIKTFGKIFNKETKADILVNSITEKFSKIPVLNKKLKYLYLVWKNPYMAAGKGTYIDSLLSKLSFYNCLKERKYIKLNSNLKSLSCDIVFLPSEPFKFTEKDKKKLQNYFPDKKILLVDGEMFCWYGSHILKSTQYFKKMITDINKIPL